MPTPISSSYLNQAQDATLKTMQRLSSGLRINSAADDAAGLATAVSLSTQAAGLLQAAANANNGISLTETAAGAVGQIGATLQQMRTLAVQAGNATLNAADRQSIQNQMGQLGQQLNQISGQTQFNGQNLLDGSFSSQFQTGAEAGQTIPIAIGNFSGASLGVAGLDVTTASGSASALGAIDQAINTVSQQQGALGAVAAGLTSAQTNAGSAAVNTLAAKSRIADTDYAAASAGQAQQGVQTQAALKALSMYNDIQKQQISSLLP